MATQIVILNGDTVQLDNEYVITWDKKGTAWQDAWCPNTIHAVIWNNLLGQNEIQTKDPSTGNMAGNTNLNATSDAVGSTTIAALLTWGETRKGQIESAKIDHGNYVENAQTSWVDAGNSRDDFIESNSATASFIDWDKTWEDFDEHLS